MANFTFEAKFVAVVHVSAADESTAREAVPRVLGAPSTVEIKLANETNAVFSGAIVTSVDFRIEGDPVRVVSSDGSGHAKQLSGRS